MNWRVKQPETVLLFSVYILTALLPLTSDPYYIYLGALFMIISLFSISYNILFGNAGLLSFGHALFFAGGAYTYALFTINVLKDPLLGLFVSILISLLLSLVIGVLTLRHTKIYFSMLTLAFGMLFYALLIKWRDITGGSDGLSGLSRSGILINLSNPVARYYFIFLVFLVTSLFLYYIHRSQLGLLIKSLGVNEDYLPYTGHSVFKIRMLANVIAGTVAGTAGSLYAILNGAVTPDLAYWTTNAEPLVAALIGGPKYFVGPLLGSLIYVAITAYAAKIADLWQFVLGTILVALILGSRGGLIELVRRIWKRS
ncbi:MAG: branched-chain amino acid ABC transporter permease [Infirmifilum sp.]|jgi:branched-chain amino acid transport system permease protein